MITWGRRKREAGWWDSVWENQAGLGPVAAGWRKIIKTLEDYIEYMLLKIY